MEKPNSLNVPDEIVNPLSVSANNNHSEAKRRKGQADILMCLHDVDDKNCLLVWYKGGDDNHGHKRAFCEISAADIQTVTLMKFLSPPTDETLQFLSKNRRYLNDSRMHFSVTSENYRLMMDVLDSLDSLRSAWINSFRANILCHCTLLNTQHLMLYGMVKENSAFFVCHWLHQDVQSFGFIDLRLPCSSHQQMADSADCGGPLWSGWRYLIADFFTCKPCFVEELVKLCKKDFTESVKPRQYIIKIFTYANFDTFDINNDTTNEVLCFQEFSEGSPFPKSFKKMLSDNAEIRAYVLFRCEILETSIAHVGEFIQIDPDIFEEQTAKRLITYVNHL